MKLFTAIFYSFTKTPGLYRRALLCNYTRYLYQFNKKSFNFLPTMMQAPLSGGESVSSGGGPAGERAVEAAEVTSGEAGSSQPQVTPSDGAQDTATQPKMSRRALKRIKRNQQREARNGQNAKRRRRDAGKDRELNFSLESLKDTEYYFENGLRKVYPYYYTFTTYTKGRWVGKEMLDVFANEFKAYRPETYAAAIESGSVKVNGKKASLDYVFKDNDYIENKIHRHELPVVGGKLKIVEDSEDFLVVDKPSSIPIHPCGRYRHNSLTYIMAIEYGYRNLRTIYRLDRLTSGVFIFCKTDSKTRLMQGHIKGRKVEKSYVARVVGEFPSEPVTCEEPIDNLTQKIGLFKIGPGGKESKTTFERLSFNGGTSVVLCKPHTGRTHQIRVHLQYIGFPIVNDPLYNTPVWGPQRGKGGHFGKPEHELIEELIKYHTSERFGNDALMDPTSLPEGKNEEEMEKGEEEVEKKGEKKGLEEEEGEGKGEDDKERDEMEKGVETKGEVEGEKGEQRNKGEGEEREPNISTDQSSPIINTLRDSPTVQIASTTSQSDHHMDTVESQTTEAKTQIQSVSESHSGFRPEKVTVDPACEECKRAYIDPKESDLVMYLHALSYRGPGWFFQTDMPEWAKEDWKPHQ